MKMDDNELKRLLQEGMEYEADRIMAEVESDPSMKDVVAPEEIYTKLKQQIHEHQEEEKRDRESRTKEEEELIRLGKIYKKKRARRKYYVLLVAVLCALGVGTVSFGDGKKVFTKIQGIFDKGSHTRISDGSDDKFDGDTMANEEDAYEKIEEVFGFVPVKMYYIPDGMEFAEFFIEEEKQSLRMYYTDKVGKSISYRVVTNYRSGSVAVDIEDVLLQEYEKEVEEVKINISKYEVKENNTFRWVARFVYGESQYSLLFMGMDENEVEKVIENLFFA